MSSDIARASFRLIFLTLFVIHTVRGAGDAPDGLMEFLNTTGYNVTTPSDVAERERKERDQMGTILRAGLVLGTISTVVIVYVAVRYVRQKRRLNKSKKYGLITTPEDDTLEMRPLDEEEEGEDEDTTVFERSTPNPPPAGGGARRGRPAAAASRTPHVGRK